MRAGWLEFSIKAGTKIAINTNTISDILMAGSNLTIYTPGSSPVNVPFQDTTEMRRIFKSIADLPGWVEIKDSGAMRTLNTALMSDVEIQDRVILIKFINSPRKTIQAPNGDGKVLKVAYDEIVREIKPVPVKEVPPVVPIVAPSKPSDVPKPENEPVAPLKAKRGKKGGK